MALQDAPMIGITEPSNFISGSSDRHPQLLIANNVKIIWNLDKILVCVMPFNVCDTILKTILHKLMIMNPHLNYFEAAHMIQT